MRIVSGARTVRKPGLVVIRMGSEIVSGGSIWCWMVADPRDEVPRAADVSKSSSSAESDSIAGGSGSELVGDELLLVSVSLGVGGDCVGSGVSPVGAGASAVSSDDVDDDEEVDGCSGWVSDVSEIVSSDGGSDDSSWSEGLAATTIKRVETMSNLNIFQWCCNFIFKSLNPLTVRK